MRKQEETDRRGGDKCIRDRVYDTNNGMND